MHQYKVQDITKPFNLNKTFSHLICILAFQNLEFPAEMIKNASLHMTSKSTLLLVLNHPVFRIPRLTSWGIDPKSKTQFRRVDKYMSPIEIPILTNPGKGERSEETWSFHYPISAYSEMLFDNGFVIQKIEEWVSDKKSYGGAAQMENKSRAEFPMFMAILAYVI